MRAPGQNEAEDMSPGALVSARELPVRSSPAQAGHKKALVQLSNLPRNARSTTFPPHSLGQLADLEVRLAASPSEARRAQELRYEIFYEEMAAVADAHARALRLDADPFDRICDHLLVLDYSNPNGAPRREPEIGGTCRLLRQRVARRHGGCFSVRVFDIAPLLERHADLCFLELGRSCVLKKHRNKRTLELLWHGIWAYVLMHNVDVMLGCASLAGTDPDRLALPLSFLHHHARAPAEWSVHARGDLRVEMNRNPAAGMDARAALRALPPLIKGYLRLGAYVGDGAVVDRQFGTTDICIVLPVATISARYVSHYGAQASRYSTEPSSAARRASITRLSRT